MSPAANIPGIVSQRSELGVVPDGRFAVLFGVWAFIAGIALFTNQTTDETARP